MSSVKIVPPVPQEKEIQIQVPASVAKIVMNFVGSISFREAQKLTNISKQDWETLVQVFYREINEVTNEL